MTQPETIDSILEQLVEDCHGIVHEQFMGQIDKNPAFDRTKARLNSLIEGIIGEDENERNENSNPHDLRTEEDRNELRAEQRKRLKQLGESDE